MADDVLDRDAIVARRAVLVTSALAALSCSSPEKAAPDAAVDTVAVPLPGSAPSSTSSAVPRDPPASSWASVMQRAPALEVPPAGSGVSDHERKALESQAGSLRTAYETLGKVWDQGPPACAPNACEADWAAVAKQIAAVEEGLRGPLCGWGEDQPISYIERDGAHRSFLREQAGALSDRFSEAAAKAGQKASWEAIRRGGVIAHPCLSCLAPPPRVFDWIGFADGSVTIDASGTSLLERVKQMLTSNATMRLSIRGHADAAEAGDKAALAKRRAEAIRTWLTTNGVAANRLEVVGLGTALPIVSAKASDRGSNRRVDFERAR
jgi:outer membrane protein OmpA-like peptidoglycan-associated protein